MQKYLCLISLLNGTLTELEKEEAAKILKLEKTDELRVVIFRVIPNNDEGKFTDKQRKELKIAEKMFLYRLQKDHVMRNTNQIIYIPESLQTVYEYDKKKKKELIDTLECFMNNNQSYKKTSTEMFVHYRTIIYRMKKIEEISGMDYENVTEMLAVRNGLIILRIMESL